MTPSEQAFADRLEAEADEAAAKARAAVYEQHADEVADKVVGILEELARLRFRADQAARILRQLGKPLPPDLLSLAPRQAPQPLTASALRELWAPIVDAVGSNDALLAAALREAEPIDLRDDVVVVAFSPDQAFQQRMVEQREDRAETLSVALRAI